MNELLDLLKSISATAYTAVFTAFVTAFVTLCGVRLTNKANNERLRLQLEHERNERKTEILRERLEELYILAEQYAISLGTH